jgi:hypothetical protein
MISFEELSAALGRHAQKRAAVEPTESPAIDAPWGESPPVDQASAVGAGATSASDDRSNEIDLEDVLSDEEDSAREQ